MTKSTLIDRGLVMFPEWTGERIYMRAFRGPLPFDLARWQPTVDMMMDGVETNAECFLMVDQTRVVAGASQRRPGVHCDGYWIAGQWRHGGGHRHLPDRAESILLASDVSGCAAYVGEYDEEPGEGGDCDHVPLWGFEQVRLEPNRVYASSALSLHESVAVARDCERTLVRINVPGWSA